MGFQGIIHQNIPVQQCLRKNTEKIQGEAKKVGEFISGKEVKTKECHSIVPLTQRTLESFGHL